MGFSSCKKQKDDFDLGGTRGDEKTHDCPTLKKNYREECTTEAGVKGFVNADCECQQRNLESDDRGDNKEGKDKMGDGRKKDKKDRRKKPAESINVSELPAGNYVIQIEGNEFLSNLRFVKMD